MAGEVKKLTKEYIDGRMKVLKRNLENAEKHGDAEGVVRASNRIGELKGFMFHFGYDLNKYGFPS
jgi:hypothetical protein